MITKISGPVKRNSQRNPQGKKSNRKNTPQGKKSKPKNTPQGKSDNQGSTNLESDITTLKEIVGHKPSGALLLRWSDEAKPKWTGASGAATLARDDETDKIIEYVSRNKSIASKVLERLEKDKAAFAKVTETQKQKLRDLIKETQVEKEEEKRKRDSSTSTPAGQPLKTPQMEKVRHVCSPKNQTSRCF